MSALQYCPVHKTIGVKIKDEYPCCVIADLRKENAALMQDNSDLKQKVIDLTMELEKVKGEK